MSLSLLLEERKWEKTGTVESEGELNAIILHMWELR
jgi:hypothetical protein